MLNKGEVFSYLDEEYSWLTHEPYLSRSSEKQLLEASAHGNKEARDQILKSWFHLSLCEAANYCQTLEFYSDLVQWGGIGAMRALERFNLSLGFRFSTYAMWWIRQSIRHNIPSTVYLVRLPNYIWEDREKRQTNIIQTVPIGTAELTVSTAPVYDLQERIQHAIACLPERQKFIIEFRMWGDTLKEIGRALSLTRERVRQLEVDAWGKLRAELGDFVDLAPPRVDVSVVANRTTSDSDDETGDIFHRRKYHPSFYEIVREWVLERGHERPQHTDTATKPAATRDAFERFFQLYEDDTQTSHFPGMDDVVAERRLIIEKLIDAIGLERIWTMQWRGSRCVIQIYCGGFHTLDVEVEGELYSLSVRAYVSDLGTVDARQSMLVPTGFRIRTEIVGQNVEYAISTIISQRARAEDLGYVIRSLIRCATTNEIRCFACSC